MASDDGARSSEAQRKTLDDIRRELEAEYPLATADHHVAEPDEAPTRISVPSYPDDEEAVERRRSARQRSRRTRGRAMAVAVGAIAGQVLLVVIYFAVTWDSIWPGAPASSPEIVEPRTEPSAAIPAPAPAPDMDRQLEAFRAELEGLADRVGRSESRIAGMEGRVKGVESSVRRLGDDVASAAAARRAERARPAPSQPARTPAPAAPLPPAPAPVTTTDPERWIPSDRPARRSSSRPSEIRPVAETVAPPAQSMLHRPPTEATPSLEPRPQSLETKAPATEAEPSVAASAPSEATPPSTTPPTLKDRVRDEWRMFKQGLAVVGQDVKTTVRDLTRKVTGE